jgi:cellulose synthase/poly-beta-1,6-N-acetylglucosamine synthase-like glycosyltransferase
MVPKYIAVKFMNAGLLRSNMIFSEKDKLLQTLPFVSVIIPTRNEEEHISTCIESLEESDYPKDKFELIVVDGGSVDKTITIILKLQKKYNNISLICENEANTSVGRNIGIKNAAGDLIINFSSHTLAEKNFIRILSTKLHYSENNIAGVGCRDKIPVNQLSYVAQCIDSITSTKFGGSFMHQQMEFREEQFVDSISFTAYKRKILEKIGFFDPDIPSGDDAELNLRLKKAGYKLLYTPETCVYRYKREKLKDFFWQMFKYGRSRMRISKKHSDSLSLVYVVPMLFILYLFLFPVVFFLNNVLLLTVWALVGAIYLLLVLSFSIHLSFSRRNLKFSIVCMTLFFIEHLAYGSGLLLELIS